MSSRFGSPAFHLSLLFIGLFLCWPSRATAQRDLGQPSAKTIAADNPTEFQQGANPKSPSNDSDPLFPVVENRKWGYMDKTGKIVIAPRFVDAYPFHEGFAIVAPFRVIGSSTAIRVEFIDKTGDTIGHMSFQRTGKPVRNKSGDQLGMVFAGAFPFSEGLALVADLRNGSKGWAFIDKGGSIVASGYQSAGSFSEGLARVEINGKWGYIDKTGKAAIPEQFAHADAFVEGLAAVRVDSRYGYIDKTGKVVVPPQFETAYGYTEGLAAVKVGGKWGYIDKTGQTVISPQFSDALGFCDGLASIKLDGKWGYIDKGGRMVIPAQYEMANKHSDGLAGVKLAGKWGFVDTSGQTVITPQFDEVGTFSEGLVEVRVGGKFGYIDKTGKYIWTPTK